MRSFVQQSGAAVKFLCTLRSFALVNDTAASTTTAAAPVANNSRASLLFYATTSYVNKCRTIHGVLPFLLIQATVACLRFTCFFLPAPLIGAAWKIQKAAICTPCFLCVLFCVLLVEK
jgi:hypothetical protein